MRVTFEDIQAAIACHGKFLAGEAGGRKANLHGADLYSANLMEVSLAGADLSGVNLKRSILYAANLEGANLAGASLKHAILEGANLRFANLSEASLIGVNLEKADLRGQTWKGRIWRVPAWPELFMIRPPAGRMVLIHGQPVQPAGMIESRVWAIPCCYYI